MRDIAKPAIGITGVIALFAGLIAVSAARGATVDFKQLASAAQQTREKLTTTAASWDIRNTVKGSVVVQLSVLRTPDRQRTIFTIEQGGRSTEIFRIVARDGVWYVTDQTGFHKYRPYEAPVITPFIYLCLDRSIPKLISSPDQLADDKLEDVQGNVATFRQMLSGEALRQVQSAVDQMTSFEAQAGQPLPPNIQAMRDQLKDQLAHGMPIRVDLSTGQLLEYGNQNLRTSIDHIQFLEKVDDKDFAVDGQNWEDRTDDPTLGNLDDLVMIAHQPGATVATKNPDVDGLLMDLKTGRYRRLPFPGGAVAPDCFLPDRRSVIVSGLDGDTGALRPYRIDLKTQQCTPLGSPLLDTGQTLGADLSPDGKTLVVTHFDPASTGAILKFQLCLIDVATGTAKNLGQPLDTAGGNWTADGKHLILLERKSDSLKGPETHTLAIMDLAGNLTEIRPGDSPLLLADRQTILFRDATTDLWHTCDLAGQKDQLYGDGLKSYGFPSPSPDGKRILMMHFISGSLPEPVELQIGASQGRVFAPVDGLWTRPISR
jgi:hypothetical protein